MCGSPWRRGNSRGVGLGLVDGARGEGRAGDPDHTPVGRAAYPTVRRGTGRMPPHAGQCVRERSASAPLPKTAPGALFRAGSLVRLTFWFVILWRAGRPLNLVKVHVNSPIKRNQISGATQNIFEDYMSI